MPVRRSKGSSGGAATTVGIDFQARMSAWVAVQILAERDASPPWLLPSRTTLEWLRCETGEFVDDLLVATSDGGFVFVQVKHSLNLSKSQDSELASALGQFVRQFLACRGLIPESNEWQRSLEPERDRLVIVVGPNAPNTIRVHLPALLRRVQGMVTGQSLKALPRNAEERRALEVLSHHSLTAWHATLGTTPSDDEIRQFFSLIRIQVLDLDEGGDAELDAKNRLRTSVLRDPSQSDAAWAALVSLCTRLAADKSGADRGVLSRKLLDAGISLQVPRSYREDIEKLLSYSRRMLALLRDLSIIHVNGIEVKIDRPSTRELQSSAESSSILVVGDPGAGKSGALHDLVASAIGRRDFIFLAVDRLSAESLPGLRQELALENELLDIIENWSGTEPAFLVIDALDAARAEQTARVLRDLIRSVIRQGGRWRVIASIRKFDLRYNSELGVLFRGRPPSDYFDPEFGGICHVNVPRLDSDELGQLEHKAPYLYTLVKETNSELYELMSVPFNLRLVADLLDGGLKASDLSPIRTQLQLLDRYWQHRLIRQDGQRDAREGILRKVCEGMVRSCRLRIDRASIADPMASHCIADLLSHNVLAEWRPSPVATPESYVLTFSHHVLFDYAVERLLLRGEPEVVVARLSEDPDLVFVVRPSLVFHFEHLWDVDPRREQFWDIVFRIVQNSRIPQICKLIGPSVAVSRAILLTDFEVLYKTLESVQEAQRNAADATFRHVIGALLAGPVDGRPVVGQAAGPWCDLSEQTSRNLTRGIAYALRPILFHICQSPELLTPKQRSNAGKAARRLLDWAWRQSPRDSRLVTPVLECVCRTFESDGIESAALIRRALDPQHVAQFGFEELPRLAGEVKRLVPSDPDLVRDIYRATFTHEETSMEATPLFESRILGMISHRKQDYAMALHKLNWAFPDFLLSKPLYAARTLIDAMEAFVAQEHAGYDVLESDFDFRGTRARIKSDFSCVWDAREGSSHSDAVQMLDAFERHLEALVTEPQGFQVAQGIVDVMAKENRLASIWRRLLSLGARFPDTIGMELLPLASAEPILTFLDTSYLAGEYLKSVFPLTSTSERNKIERAIMSIPSLSQQAERGEHIRDQLLACLPVSMLVAEDSRVRIEYLRHNEKLPLNLPPISFGGVTSREYTDDDYLREHGISVDQGVSREIRELEKAMREFVPQNASQVPSAEEALAIIPSVHALKVLLASAEREGVHPELCKSAWGHLLEACNRLIRSKSFSCREQIYSGIDSIILEGSRHPEPVHDPKCDAQFDRTQSWGSPAPRVEAARGLMLLGSIPECMTEELRGQIEKLSRDEVPAVRFQVSGSLNALYYSAPELMWEVLERVCHEEASRGVLKFVLHGPLEKLAGSHTVRVVGLAKNIFARIMEGLGAEGVREGCVNLFGRLYIWLGEASCGDMILNIAGHVDRYLRETDHVVSILRAPLSHYKEVISDGESEAVRKRAWGLVACILRSATENLSRLWATYNNVSFDAWPKDRREELQSLIKLIDHLGNEVYFASGAYKEKNMSDEEEISSIYQRERFYQEAGPALDDLADVGIASSTHRLLETLESFIPFDPPGVFIRVGRAIRAGEKGGYQYESLAADLFVMLVERYLAEYRHIFRESEDCRQTLREILDIFVQAGWPSARRLTYHLDEIFR